MLSIAEIKEKISPLCSEYGIKRAYLFGSYARGEADEKSDVDLRIEKGANDKLKSLIQVSSFRCKLEDVLKKNVDLITLLPTQNLYDIFRKKFSKKRFYCMSLKDTDAQILQHIVNYCNEVEVTIISFGADDKKFLKNFIYRNAVSMPILQIGELVNHLSADFKSLHPEISWRAIVGKRNHFAHGSEPPTIKIAGFLGLVSHCSLHYQAIPVVPTV